MKTVATWMQYLPTVTAQYALNDIFNCDETGLFRRGLPNRTLTVKSVQSKGGKLAKERVTILLTVSAVGEILQPLIIGKSANPRCFNNRKPSGVQYYNNNSAWMTSTIFDEYLELLNSYMRDHSRNILLFMDNASVHVRKELSNIKVVFSQQILPLAANL